jgi:hypothetical protein
VDASDDDHASQINYGFIAVPLSSKIFMAENFVPVPDGEEPGQLSR